MPPKKKAAPIDRPISRAYLRDFSTWSTAFPPGVSDPTSLRVMENMMITREGALKIRPGLKCLSLMADGTAFPLEIVGAHEAFYLNDGKLAYLFACREEIDIDGVMTWTVGFRVMVEAEDAFVVMELEDVGIDFSLPGGAETLNFSEGTTYVKYLQIDNKIFALSNNGEPMRLFYVGSEKIAKRLSSITRPSWLTSDKLSVVHPDATWVTNGTVTSSRTNLVANSSFASNANGWGRYLANSEWQRNGFPGQSGTGVLTLQSGYARRNSVANPSFPTPASDPLGWSNGSGTAWAQVFSNILHVHTGLTKGKRSYVSSNRMPIIAGRNYYIRWFTTAQSGTGFSTSGMMWRWWNSALSQIGGDQVKEFGALGDGGQTRSLQAKAPSGAVYLSLHPWGGNGPNQNNADWYLDDVMVTEYADGTSFFNGSSGANYFWLGTPNNSSSVYHPPADTAVYGNQFPVTAGAGYSASAYFKAETLSRDCYVGIQYLDVNGAGITTQYSAATPDNDAGWTRATLTNNIAPAGAVKGRVILRVNDVPRNELHYVDAVLVERSATVNAYFDGNYANTLTKRYRFTGGTHASTSIEDTYTADISIPAAETKTTETLISSAAADNIYSVGVFYCFTNEIGESAMSQVTTVKVQRPPTAWLWETPNAAGEPSGTSTDDPTECADQLVCIIPESAFDEAVAQGATGWSLYALSWSDQSVVPVTATRVATRDLEESKDYDAQGWLAVTPAFTDGTDSQALVPNLANRFNYSNPPRGSQGLVAADRMIIVNDPTEPARIRWTSNVQGYYGDFSASKGGGYKTLTSGNLQVPASVKLWQNPQSVDTLTILCSGTDSYSTGYYMAPAEITAQSESTAIMGFEETTATPGTTAPYGCEVMNNALYHPLDEQLMKSTATSYNINHKSMTENIRNMWLSVADHHRMVSSQLENRLYYLVNNAAGEELTEGYYGNEVWVLDTSQPEGSWSRWMTGGVSLRKMSIGGVPHMSLTRPDGIYAFSEQFMVDAYNEGPDNEIPFAVTNRPFGWRAETNTQGANRAHDAWAHVQQIITNFGNWKGGVRYGIRGKDLNGKPVEYAKVFRANLDETDDPPNREDVYDQEDFLQIRRDMKEWTFFVESVANTTTLETPLFGTTRYNYHPNPSIEVSADGWESNSALGTRTVCTVAQSSEQAWSGTSSLKVTVPEGEITAEVWANTSSAVTPAGMFPDDDYPLESRTPKLFSAYVYSPTGGKFKAERLFFDGTFFTTDVPAGVWTRVQVPILNRENLNGFYGVVWADPVPGGVFYLDGLMIEEMPEDEVATPYFDGDSTDTGDFTYDWSGTVGLSESTEYGQTGTLVEVILDSWEPAHGQINAVQYRYTPVSVNVDYEQGSIETFTYARDQAQIATNTQYGVTIPMADDRVPPASL